MDDAADDEGSEADLWERPVREEGRILQEGGSEGGSLQGKVIGGLSLDLI